MKLFMTSDMGGITEVNGELRGCCINEENGLLEELKKCWKSNSKGLMVCSNPIAHDINDKYNKLFKDAFNISGLLLDSFDICDSRHGEALVEQLDEYDMILLCGGHVLTENKFMQDINLKEKIQKYQGIVIGISAGTMNCATTVYAAPEEKGEAIDPNYKRYISGLGLTEINVLPHLQWLQTLTLDGMRMVEDIVFEDSKTKEIYGLIDGSYILVKDGKSVLYGEGYLIKDGKMKRICKKGDIYLFR